MDSILVAGLWLDSSVWADVQQELDGRGHRGVAVPLPGQGDDDNSATLDDQVAAVVAAVDAATGPVLVAGHSAACTLAWLAADARPDEVAKVALIGGFPASEGERYADFFEPVNEAMGFPGWEQFEGPDSDDLDRSTKDAIEAAAIPVPVGVTRGEVNYRNANRLEIPVLLVCPEFTPDQARQWIAAGDSPELARSTSVEYADLDSGHWPMFTRPAELAEILAKAAS